nr:2427_t:CDS:2 [Entrophospora candida]
MSEFTNAYELEEGGNTNTRPIRTEMPYDAQTSIMASPSNNDAKSKKQLPLKTSTITTPTSSATGIRTKLTTPQRTTKTSQKLVLFPEESENLPATATITNAFEDIPPEYFDTPAPLQEVSSSLIENLDSVDAERLSKKTRDDYRYPRATAYCTAEGYYLGILMEFLKEGHNVQPKLYDECLYAPYHFPLIPGKNTKILSSSPTHTSNGQSFIDRQIENYENHKGDNSNFIEGDGGRNDTSNEDSLRKNSPPLIIYSIGEVFYFNYGVVVFWNFTEEQELLILDDLASYKFVVRPLKDDEVKCETFHFQYDVNSSSQPRIFNDMITLKSENHMIKLTISHAISQSTKLSLYEWQMDDTINRTKSIPKMLALTGRLNLNRTQVTKLSGELFKLRMNVNLISNVLDTPEIFWSEPFLQPLYNAIRTYLEISQRVKVLNDRCNVINDLLDMLREDIGNSNMTQITWIIIWLIVIAVFVATGEIAVKFFL